MRFRSRRAAAASLLSGLVLLTGPITVAVAQTSGSEGPGFFESAADAAGIGVSFGNPGSEPNPVAAGLVPNAHAVLGAGPSGRARASMLWPGPLAANAGTLATLVGAPLPPEVLANANYPVKAEADASGGGRDEQTLGPMSAVVNGADSSARTALSDFDSPAVVSAARIVTSSRSYLEGGRSISVAETVLQGVEIGGVVDIETVRTVARGETDGTTATTEHEVVVTGVSVQGQPARIDHDGLQLGDQQEDNPLNPVTVGANQVLVNMGMEAFVTEPVEEQTDGGGGRVHSGAVVFHWNLGDGGDYLTVVLGGASVQMNATAGGAFDLGDLAGDFGGDPGGGFDAPADPGPLPAPELPDLGSGAGALDGPAPSGATGTTGGEEAFAPIDFNTASAVSDRVPMGWMIIGLLGMGLVGMGLHGLRTHAIVAALSGSTCPLERGAT